MEADVATFVAEVSRWAAGRTDVRAATRPRTSRVRCAPRPSSSAGSRTRSQRVTGSSCPRTAPRCSGGSKRCS